MTVVKGQIESLKKVKAELQKNGIHRFKSIGDINIFLKNYRAEEKQITNQTHQELKNEISSLKKESIRLNAEYNSRIENESYKLKLEINSLQNKLNLIKEKDVNLIIKALNSIKLKTLQKQITQLEREFDRIIAEKTSQARVDLQQTNYLLNEYTSNREQVINNRLKSKLDELSKTKRVVDDLYPRIAGAVGESMVVKELEKLSDHNILFNDFSVNFPKPIYNRKQKNRIFSIQIDHLLVTRAGIFLLETKNWSKESLANHDLRSPVDQIMRNGYALFTMINGRSKQSDINLKKHHWGDKQIPIRTVIVMINHKPKVQFKHVKIKTLNELIWYIQYFDPIFNDIEVRQIASFLESLKNKRDLDTTSIQAGGATNWSVGHIHKPSLQNWLKEHPDQNINEYYRRFGNT